MLIRDCLNKSPFHLSFFEKSRRSIVKKKLASESVFVATTESLVFPDFKQCWEEKGLGVIRGLMLSCFIYSFFCLHLRQKQLKGQCAEMTSLLTLGEAFSENLRNYANFWVTTLFTRRFWFDDGTDWVTSLFHEVADLFREIWYFANFPSQGFSHACEPMPLATSLWSSDQKLAVCFHACSTRSLVEPFEDLLNVSQ